MNSSFLHSPAWQRYQTSLGFLTQRVEQQLYVKRPILGSRYWLSSRCQLTTQHPLPDFCKEGWFARFEPIDEASLQTLKQWSEKGSYKLVPTIALQPRQTIVIDIHKSYEEVLQSMKQKQRYNIRLGQRNGVEVSSFSENLAAVFPRFWQLLSLTARRQGFRTHPASHYQTMLSELEKDQMAHLLFAHKDGKDLATLLLITHEGEATYLHGASSEEQRELMAPYVLHAEAIQFAQHHQCHHYDLWGSDLVFDKEKQEWLPQAGHSSAGTSRFKLGFNGEVINYPGTFDLIFNPFCYTAYQGLRTLHSKKRSFT